MKLKIQKNRLKILGLKDKHRIKLREELSYIVPNFWFTPQHRNGGWDGRKSFIRADATDAGFLRRIIKILKTFKKYRKKGKILVEDLREFQTFCPEGLQRGFDLIAKRNFQQAVLSSITGIGQGLIHVGVGGGKTYIMGAVCLTYPTSTILITVPTTTLLKKTVNDLREFTGENIGVIGDKNYSIERITVSTYASLHPRKIKEGPSKGLFDWKKGAIQLAKNSDILMVDECHHGTSETHKAFLRSVASPNKLGFSGTINLRGPQLLLEGLFGPVLASYSLLWLIEQGYCAQGRVAWLKYPTEEKKFKAYREGYDYAIIDNVNRNKAYTYMMTKLVEKEHLILGLVRFKPHGQKFVTNFDDTGISAHYVDGTMDSAYIMEMAQNLNCGNIDTLISTAIFDEGVDIPMVTALAMLVGEKKLERLEQRLGRVLRAIGPKTDALILDSEDIGSQHTKSHSEDRFAFYKKMKFPIREYNFIGKDGKFCLPPKTKVLYDGK